MNGSPLHEHFQRIIYCNVDKFSIIVNFAEINMSLSAKRGENEREKAPRKPLVNQPRSIARGSRQSRSIARVSRKFRARHRVKRARRSHGREPRAVTCYRAKTILPRNSRAIRGILPEIGTTICERYIHGFSDLGRQ